MSCRLELPITGDGDGLLARFNTLLPKAASVGSSLIVDAANEFFRETTRWRFENLFIDLETDDQEMILDTGEQTGNIEIITIADTVYELSGHDEIPVTRKSDLTDHSYGANAQYRDLSSHGRRNYAERHGGYDHSVSRRGWHLGGKEFYEPHPGQLILACKQHCDATFRVPVTLAPISMEGINMIPAGTLRAYREGIVSLAIVKAMMIPEKTWSMQTMNPDRLIALHQQNVDRHIRKAKEWFNRDDSEYRPYRGRLAVPESGYYD